MEKTIKWQGIQDKTLEVLTIREDREGFRVSSNIHGTLGEERINLNYQIVL
ncbi:MAG: hypothetical protein H7Z75_01765, partial [Ferruginibacter sp.]|nr:hypothetical protein [Cytophagales bacterium]